MSVAGNAPAPPKEKPVPAGASTNRMLAAWKIIHHYSIILKKNKNIKLLGMSSWGNKIKCKKKKKKGVIY